jgi:hypothetical protein
MNGRPHLTCIAALMVAVGAAVGCTSGGPTVNRVQPSLISKDIFEGEWWVAQTALESDADSPGPTFTGDMGFADRALDKSGSAGTVARIRWVIDENFLFAYRAFELVEGANDDGRSPDYRGQPIAAFEIEDHVDVRAQYNPVTGETQNIVEENTEDRRWYERELMRVDWSENQVQSFYFISDLNALGAWQLEDGQFFIQEGGSQGFPKSWEPQFVTVGDDPNYRFADEWPEGSDDVTHYMSFVSLMNLSPGGSCFDPGGAPCQTVSVPHRLAFLRVPPNHQYDAATQTNEEYDRFGVFRTLQRTYLRADDSVTRRCDRNIDCGTGGYCDAERHVCAGGLGEDYGETDALAFLRPRHNLFEESLTDLECTADWECDGRFEDTPGVGGSVCDRTALRCTVPMRERTLRSRPDGPGSVVYHLNAGFPKHLVGTAMQVVSDWNEGFMRGWRVIRDEALPAYDAVRVSCQTDDPTRYCFCGSPDDRNGTCTGKYDPFVTPERWTELGVDDPYRCHVENNEFAEPTSPGTYDDYPLPQAYRHQFVGDECILVLRPNTCDWYRTDESQSCDDVVDDDGDPVGWEQLGDIRYQFLNYIDQVSDLWFGGIAAPLADPTTGELIVSNASVAARPIESAATDALEYFPVLRCLDEERGCEPGEENAGDRYLSGENLRGYFSRLGRTERPQGLASSGSDGFSIGDTSRPALRVDVNQGIRDLMDRARERIDLLYGQNGRAQVLSDRMRRLAGTPIEDKLMASLGMGGRDALNRHYSQGQPFLLGATPQATISDDAVLDEISPFRGAGFSRTLNAASDLEATLASRNVCNVQSRALRSRFGRYWAEAFRGRPAAEASIRMQQLQARMIFSHEMGHAVGLRHNFAASLDRDHYGDGYFHTVMGESPDSSDDLNLPRLEDFDLDDDGFLAGEEFDVYLERQRDVRNERAERGAYNYTSSSVMDYSGDLSDAQGIGRYDIAATLWNQFELREVYDLRDADGPVRMEEDGPFQGLARSHKVDRVWWASYRGGESCFTDGDCPASRGSGALLDGQPVYQRCVQNPRNVFPQEVCRGQSDCVCSSFDADVDDYADFAAYLEGTSTDRVYAPVRYLYCPDNRTNDISWCSRHDSGESFREVIDHYRRTWEEQYPLVYYRRFDANGASGAYSQAWVRDAAKIYQHLFFRFNFEPGFTLNTGPLGFDDQFLASVDAMNWFIEIVNLPDEGSYAYDADTNVYRWLGEQVDVPGSDFSLLPGQGFGMWTKYQDGYFGFFRAERAGVFYDKYYALRALAIRDWRLNFTIDERYFINFYDLFQTEMTELFGGIILQDENWFAPRLRMDGDEPVVQHMSWYRGALLGECEEDGRIVPCRGSQPDVYPGPALEGTTNEVLRSWAAILALAQFPVYYDTTFEQRLLVFKAGSGGGFEIPDIQPNGRPTCVYGTDGLGKGHFVADPEVPNGCDSADDADYVVFESSRFRTPYVAVKVRPNLELNLEEEQVGFQLLRRLVDLQDELALLTEDDPSRADKERELQQGESFLEYLIELQTAYGISNFF